MTFQHIRVPCFALLATLTTLLPCQAWAETIQIEAGKMVLLHKSNQAEFNHNVHLTRAEFELFADRLMAYYNDHDLERAEAFGNIKLRQGDVTGSADKAILDQKNNTLTLIGHAVLEQGGNRLEGEKIIHRLNQEKTVVLPAKGGRTHLTIESKAIESKSIKSNNAGKALNPAINPTMNKLK